MSKKRGSISLMINKDLTSAKCNITSFMIIPNVDLVLSNRGLEKLNYQVTEISKIHAFGT